MGCIAVYNTCTKGEELPHQNKETTKMPLATTVFSMIATYFAALLTVARAIRSAAQRLSDRFDRIAPAVVLHGPQATLEDAAGTTVVSAPAGIWSVAPLWQTPVLTFTAETECRFDVHPEFVESILPLPTERPTAKRVAARQVAETAVYDRPVRRNQLATMSMAKLRAIAAPHGIRGNSKAKMIDRIIEAGI